MPHLRLRSRLACLFTGTCLAISLVGCDRAPPRSSALDRTVQHLQASNIRPWGGGQRGTNRWVGEPEAAVPIIDVVVPAAHSDAEAPMAAAAHGAVAEVNRRMTGLLLLRDVPEDGRRAASHIEISYLSAYVPPATIDDRRYCSNVSEARGQGAPFRPGPDGRRNHGIAWINLGNGHCTVGVDLVVHQLAVALGLDAPFAGFDAGGPATSEAMWDALLTLYANPVGTSAGNVLPNGKSATGLATSNDKRLPDVPYLSGP